MVKNCNKIYYIILVIYIYYTKRNFISIFNFCIIFLIILCKWKKKQNLKAVIQFKSSRHHDFSVLKSKAVQKAHNH